MRVAARRGMWGLGVALLIAAACGEPGTATGPAPVVDPAGEVALLAVVEGKVTVRDPQGAETPARAEMPLKRSDTVVTTPGSLAVVVLANGYVLKLEEDQATPVRALAHLDDPPPAESVAELFEQALGAEAFARVGGSGRLERIAGWNARRASGETPAPVAKLEAPPAPVKAIEAAPVQAEEQVGEPDADRPRLDDGPSDGRGEGELGRADVDKAEAKTSTKAKDKNSTSSPPSGPSDPLASPLPSKKADDVESSKRGEDEHSGTPPPGNAGPPRPAPEPESNSPGADLADSWIFETGPDRQVTRTSLPAALKSQRQALAQCVADASPGVAAPELRLRVAGGTIKEVALGGGKPAPACARGLLNKPLSGTGGDGWVIVRVRR